MDNEWHIMKLLDKSIKKRHSHVHVLLHKFATKIILNNDANFENIKNSTINVDAIKQYRVVRF